MNAMYFMGMREGVAKESKEKYFAVSILWLNGYGSYELKQLYASAELFDEIKRLDLPRGSAVVVCAMGKTIGSLAPDKRFKALNLGELAK